MNWQRILKQHNRWMCLIGSALFAALHSGEGFAQNTAGREGKSSDLPPEVQAVLEKQAAALQSISFEVTETLAGSDVPEDYGGPSKFLSRATKNRFYIRSESLNTRNAGHKAIHEDSFDGTIFYAGDPNEDFKNRPQLLVKFRPGDTTDPGRQTQPIRFPYLQVAGYWTPQFVSDLEHGFSIRSLTLYSLDQGDSVRVETIGKRLRVSAQVPDPMVLWARSIDLEQFRSLLAFNPPGDAKRQVDDINRIRNMPEKRSLVLTLDPQYGYGVVEQETYTQSGQRIERVEAEQWKYYADAGIWLPGRCTESFYMDRMRYADFSQNPRLVSISELNEIRFNAPQNQQYALNYTRAGSIIGDRTLPAAETDPQHQVGYIVAANGSLLRDVADDVLVDIKSGGRNRFFTILLMALMSVPIILTLRRRFKKT
jgi:hypothetical protein